MSNSKIIRGLGVDINDFFRIPEDFTDERKQEATMLGLVLLQYLMCAAPEGVGELVATFVTECHCGCGGTTVLAAGPGLLGLAESVAITKGGEVVNRGTAMVHATTRATLTLRMLELAEQLRSEVGTLVETAFPSVQA